MKEKEIKMNFYWKETSNKLKMRVEEEYLYLTMFDVTVKVKTESFLQECGRTFENESKRIDTFDCLGKKTKNYITLKKSESVPNGYINLNFYNRVVSGSCVVFGTVELEELLDLDN